MERRRLPADLSAVRCTDADGWCFYLGCDTPRCSYAKGYPLQLLLQQHRCGEALVLDVARRFRCEKCGAKPARLSLTERFDRMPGTMCGDGDYSRVIDLLPLLGC